MLLAPHSKNQKQYRIERIIPDFKLYEVGNILTSSKDGSIVFLANPKEWRTFTPGVINELENQKILKKLST